MNRLLFKPIDYDEIHQVVGELNQKTRFPHTKNYIQHGQTSVFCHSLSVAKMSCQIVNFFHIPVDKKSLIRGALLHDYFLYDWHTLKEGHYLHGFTHPRKALENAREELTLNAIEENMILRHMFPLTPIPPRYREAWILCLADKISSLQETIMDRKAPVTEFLCRWVFGRSGVK